MIWDQYKFCLLKSLVVGLLIALMALFFYSMPVSVTFILFSRPDTSFTWFMNPFKSLRYMIWEQYKFCLLKSLVVAMLIALMALFFYSMPVSMSRGKMPIQSHSYIPKGMRGMCDATGYQGDQYWRHSDDSMVG